jgi:ankyrin repeat protein
MLEKRLATLPKTLAETYARILEKIPDDYRPNAIKILQFLTYSEHPISLEEAVDVIATDPTRNPPFEARNRMRKANETLLLCSSLVSPVTRLLVERSSQTRERIELHLAHFSVKEFLRSGKIESTFSQQLSENVARASIVQVCLAYLSSLKLGLQLQRIRVDYPLAQISAKIWMSSAAATESDKRAQDMILKFFSIDRRGYTNWCRLIALQDQADATTATISRFDERASLYHVALLGLTQTMAVLLKSSDHGPIPARDFEYALDAAIRAGNCRMVELLLQHQQRFKNVSQISLLVTLSRALLEASLTGYKQIVKTLIQQGADVNAQGGVYDTALQAAASSGHESIVQLLLDAGANINARGGRYGTALIAATIEQRYQVVQILLARGADTNIEHEKHGTALRAACVHNHTKIVRMLLENDAMNKKPDKGYAQDLYAASSAGHNEVVKLLLDTGADVNFCGEPYGTALQVASAEGHLDVVRMLVDAGADVNSRAGRYGNALRVAAYKGYPDVVQVLIDAGTEVNADGGGYGSVLQAASAGGHEDVVQMLLDRGADVNAQIERYGIAVQIASPWLDTNVVRIPLDRGPDVEFQGKYYRNALQAASHAGHEKAVRLLLDAGADVNAHSGEYGNALQAASAGGHEIIVRMLLDRGACLTAKVLFAALSGNPTTKGTPLLPYLTKEVVSEKDVHYGQTVLHWAARAGDRDLTNRCLDLGADVNTTDEYGRTALHYAAQTRRSDIVRVLIQANADREIRDSNGKTALDYARFAGLDVVSVYTSKSRLEILAILQQSDSTIESE